MKKSDAIKYFGNPTALAKALGITVQAISQWGDDVPTFHNRHFQIEVLTGGKLKAIEGQRHAQPA